MMDLWATVPYYTAYLSRALLALGVPVTIGSITYYLDTECFSSRGLPLDPGLLNVVGRYHLPRILRRTLKSAEALINLVALSARFLRSPPDIVHVQYLPMLRWRIPFDLWFLNLMRRRGAQIVLTVHDLLPHDTAEVYRTTFRRLYTWVDEVICHSDHVRSRLIEEFAVPAARIAVIPHGPFFFDLPDSPEPEAGAAQHTVVVWQGILFPYKGVDLLLDSWQRVEAEFPGARLLIAGTGSPEAVDTVRDHAGRLGLKQVTLELRFLTTEELMRVYRSAGIVVYPYRAITTSGALATGLALGKTVLASDLPVFRELLTHNENALLVKPGDVESLAEALLRLLRDPSLRLRLASEVKKMHFGEQSWPAIAAQTLHTYHTVLATHSNRSPDPAAKPSHLSS